MSRRDSDGGLRSEFRERIPHFQWTTIETGGVSRGVPDSEYCHNGAQGWIEFKWCKRNAIKSLEPFQVSWHLRRWRAGGRSFIIVRRSRTDGPRTESCDEIHIFSGRYASELKELGLECGFPLYRGDGGPAGWNWSRIEELLLG